MKSSRFKIDISDFAAISTWAIIFVITIYFIQANDGVDADLVLISSLFITYLIPFFGIGKFFNITTKPMVQAGLLSVMLASAYGIMWFVPAGYLSILTIIWVAVLVNFVSIRTTIVITLVVLISWFWLFSWRWDFNNIWFSAALYGAFHFFSILMAHQTREAMRAKEQLEQMNRELVTSQELVKQASRQQERTRIARDLHDLIGHHLTALIINLEVAKHQSTGAALQQVNQSHALAKLLLSDVRDAITEIRANESIDIKALIDLWCSYIPTISIHTEIDERITWQDFTITETLSFCILEALTNSMRHANSTEVTIVIRQHQQRLLITIDDNGQTTGEIKFGNGLNGMLERIESVSGTLHADHVDGHFRLTIELPIEASHDD